MKQTNLFLDKPGEMCRFVDKQQICLTVYAVCMS